MKSIMITGGAGFIGKNLVHELLRQNYKSIIVVDNDTWGTASELVGLGVEIEICDIGNQTVITSLMRHCSAVIHLAASTNVTLSNMRPEKCLDDNVFGTFNLLKAASEKNIDHFISASTGGALMGDVNGGVNETMAPNPQSIYGASKLAAEGLCSAFASSFNLPTLSLRFSNIYGENSLHKTSAIAMLCKSIFEERVFELYGDGSQVRDYLYVGDLAKIIASCLEQKLTGTIQLGSGKPTQLKEVINLIDQINPHTQLRIQKCPKRLGEVERTWCDVGLAKDKIKNYRLTNLQMGLQRTFDWFSAQYN